MNTRPYYVTWNHQPPTDAFRVQSAMHDEFILDDERRVYDFISTSFQTNFGHSHSLIVDSIQQQLHTMPVASPKAAFSLKSEVSTGLHQYLGLDDGRLFFTTSGSESVENALKMARQVTGRTKILARSASYHGASLGALSVTGDWRNSPHFTIDEQTIRIPEPFDDPTFAETRRLIEDSDPANIAAMIFETISGTNGVEIPPPSWYAAVTETCREHDIKLIADEVLCGFGRCQDPFAFQAYGLKPDFVCMSKGISGGYVPFGAVWTGPSIATYYEEHPLTCGLTNYAHPLGLAALGSVLHLLNDESFLNHQRLLQVAFDEQLTELRSLPGVRQIRHRGLLAAIDFEDDFGVPNWQTCFEGGLHLFSHPQRMVLAPPFVSTVTRLCQAFTDLRAILTTASTS